MKMFGTHQLRTAMSRLSFRQALPVRLSSSTSKGTSQDDASAHFLDVDGVKRAHNFSAGPSQLPFEVLKTVQRDLLNWNATGMSFMELSHRDAGGPVQSALMTAKADLRGLLNIPANYKILFFHGGAHAQFAAVPLNFLGARTKADYVHTGFWSDRARGEALKYCDAAVVADAADNGFTQIPDVGTWRLRPDAAYVHLCANETIAGLELLEDPRLDGMNVVADMTSTLLSRPVDVSRYACIYASSGKNLGPAGFCVAIVREDMLAIGARDYTPSILNYSLQAGSQPIPSLYNTPPTLPLYVAHLVFQEYVQRGGLAAIEADAKERAALLYDVVDSSNGFYTNRVQPAYRSRMNIPFRVRDGDCELEKKFVAEAEAHGIMQIFGHPLFGGLRATLYNGVPTASLHHLVAFMRKFQAANA
eukprot:CAMPEP_0177640780 /NCGR_PEP_ID=MMETSP0447-20121125/6721_1 /TAXON_ID=0 /ORGANISM="Stygamoeba regulata, Strain BSH-02190019" /LENGTH=417 /DNA_ID=CAMNT_0019142865 /DNA_START=198 /DNA_END=1451 /DNA_ORIENTATION=-